MKLSTLVVAAVLLTGAYSQGQSDSAWLPFTKWSSSYVKCVGEKGRVDLATRAEKGDAEAQDILGTQHLSTCEGKNDPAKGIELLTQAALHGNAHAQLRLGQAYQNGTSVPKNEPAAVAWFEKAAAQGNPQAKNNLGMFYLDGKPVAKDQARAARLFQAAAEQGLVEAAYNLATMYDQGWGMAQDYRAARKWYQQAAEHKDADAEYRLAMLLEQGLGGDKDRAAALRWMQAAADNGSEEAQLKLGLTPPSEAKTLSSGYFQYQIAEALFEGKGMEKDQARALKFLEKSAEAGYPPAFLALGRMYSRGDGVATNEAKALGYFEQAIAHDAKYDMAYNALAWTLVTAADPKVRNPGKALEYAMKAIELSGGTHAYQFDTLAHAYFGLGDLDHACEMETKALALEPGNGFYQQALTDFQTSKAHAKPAK
jgi:TPR repeat protein